MTDINRLIASLKRRSAHAKAFGHDVLFVKLEDLDALVEALEKAQQRIDELENDEVRQRQANAEHQLHMAELAKNNLRASRKAQFRKRKAAEQRIAELESRTVTVKQFDEFQICHYGATEDYAKGYIDCQNNFFKWLTAAGIKWEAE
ncbi:hypothetical protein [Klebsiella aerogenes]|uniref:hypothetical protein n=1 Tax=Klebsiella aerogenes TaxID=548 RepID=UPI0020A6B514|nr:hypothetical protein [Klebsiella aerogenes]